MCCKWISDKLNNIVSDLPVIKKNNKKVRELEKEVDSLRGQVNYMLVQKLLEDNKKECELREDIGRVYSGLVSIIVLNRDGSVHLKRLFESLIRCKYYNNIEVIIFDNASTDGSLKYVEQMSQLCDFPVKLIQNAENISFSAANNIAVKSASGNLLLFMNNDIEVTDYWLDELIRTYISKDNVGAVGARLIYPEIASDTKRGKKSYCIQHAGIDVAVGTRSNETYIQPSNARNGMSVSLDNTESVSRLAVTAALLLVSRKAFDAVGGYDEKYVYGYEDVDLCLSLDKAGYINYYCPSCIAYHYEFGTQDKDETDEVKERRTANMRVYKSKWDAYLRERLEMEY